MREAIKKLALACVLGGPLLFPAKQAGAIELALAIDDSGSIAASEFSLQTSAYASVLNALLPTDGSVAVGVWQFSSTVRNVFPVTTITASNKAALVALFPTLVRAGGATNISGGIDVAASALLAFTGTGNEIIDVSTDGSQTVAGNPDTAADNAVLAGIEQVNCLGIGAGFDCGFIAGAGAFSIAAPTFAQFQTALQTKIGTELGVPPTTPPSTVPEPATLLLLAAGVFGLVARLRRR